MQGQDSTSNAFPGAFYLRYRPNGINLRWIQNNEVPTDASVYDGHPVMVQMRQSNSSINNHNPVQLQDSLAEDDLPSNGMSNGMDKSTSGVNTQTLAQSQDLLVELPSSPVAGTGIVQSLEERHSGSLINPFQLNVNMSPGNGQLTNRSLPLQQASSSVFPQNIERRAPEDEQLGAGLVLTLETAPVMHQPSSVTASGLGAGAGPSDTHRTIGVVGETQHSQRTMNHQDFVPTNLATWTTNSLPQLPAQPAISLSFDCVPNTSSVIEIVQPTPPMQQPVGVSYSSESMQPFQWNAVTSSRTGLPFTSTYIVNGGDASLVEDNSRNTQRNGMLPSEFQRGNLEHMLRNLNFVPETNSPGNIAFNSRNSSTIHVRQSSTPIQSPQHNIAQQYEQRITAIPEVVNLIEPQGQGTDHPRHMGDLIVARQRELSVRGNNARPSDIHLRSGLIIQAERQSGVHPEVPVSSLTTSQMISGLLYEVRNALQILRRGGSLQHEDLPMINYTVSHGLPEDSDLDQEIEDEMTEELDELEELMIEYRSGLAGAVIEAHMKRQKYEANVVGSPLEDEKCCICQENYADGEDLGKLDCGHYFHFDCIKQWLNQKNNCPICKKKALQG
ncbi:probable E3 ubiquitin-protein ligase RHG1A [Hevea brasiliensis]|uniref:probable E3 ubiquitin-protein ligase RHG1A n=1 Tax=Hevea brasiliensis TaxID=3981 RepID=UPI0025DFA43C|nr:probable E3 ubiquitin-protein ligase RHG1A [Hevea brasiliensis]